ncbi:MAG: protein-disulfide reductase DsbD family protein [Thermoguttaceae bacterium]
MTILRSLFLLVLLLLCSFTSLFAVDFGNLQNLYGDFRSQPQQVKEMSIEFSAFLAQPAPTSPPSVGAYLVVQARLGEGWHLYSITQPDGGPLRGMFSLARSGEYEPLGPFQTASEVDVEYSDLYDGLAIESHVNSATWICPLQLNGTTTIETLQVSGKFDGQICQDADRGGVCVQVNGERFTAEYSPDFDVAPLLKKAAEIADFLQKVGKGEEQWNEQREERGGEERAEQGRERERQGEKQGGERTLTSSTGLTSAKGEEGSNEGKGATGKEQLIDLEYRPQETVQVNQLSTALLYAFLGGLILNIMPCVLPVIGLKILSFFEQAGKSRVRAFVLNLWYSLGLLSVFIVLAFLSVGLSRMFTYDLFNIIMVCIVFTMSLSLMDVWELRVPSFLGSGKSVALMEQEGAIGAFFKGIITTLLAIPCGAPLLSPALSWADEQIRAGSSTNVLIAYVCIGLGMSSPYLLIGAFPELLRFLPKPGMWMLTFKKIMGFFLLVAVVWILYFISLDCIVPVIALLFALWFACWLIGRLPLTASQTERGISWFFGLFVVILVLLFSFNLPNIPNPYTLQNAMSTRLNDWAGINEEKFWQPFSENKLKHFLEQDRPVLVDFTADWCMSCKYFEATVLQTEEIKKLLEEKGVESLKADCTKQNMEGAVFLAKLGSSSVPVLALFQPDHPDQPIVIRGGFSRNTVVDLLQTIR